MKIEPEFKIENNILTIKFNLDSDKVFINKVGKFLIIGTSSAYLSINDPNISHHITCEKS